jgi:hypothetical protein
MEEISGIPIPLEEMPGSGDVAIKSDRARPKAKSASSGGESASKRQENSVAALFASRLISEGD